MLDSIVSRLAHWRKILGEKKLRSCQGQTTEQTADIAEWQVESFLASSKARPKTDKRTVFEMNWTMFCSSQENCFVQVKGQSQTARSAEWQLLRLPPQTMSLFWPKVHEPDVVRWSRVCLEFRNGEAVICHPAVVIVIVVGVVVTDGQTPLCPGHTELVLHCPFAAKNTLCDSTQGKIPIANLLFTATALGLQKLFSPSKNCFSLLLFFAISGCHFKHSKIFSPNIFNLPKTRLEHLLPAGSTQLWAKKQGATQCHLTFRFCFVLVFLQKKVDKAAAACRCCQKWLFWPPFWPPQD